MSFSLVLFQLWLWFRVFSGFLGGTYSVVEVDHSFVCGIQIVVDIVDFAVGIRIWSSL